MSNENRGRIVSLQFEYPDGTLAAVDVEDGDAVLPNDKLVTVVFDDDTDDTCARCGEQFNWDGEGGEAIKLVKVHGKCWDRPISLVEAREANEINEVTHKTLEWLRDSAALLQGCIELGRPGTSEAARLLHEEVETAAADLRRGLAPFLDALRDGLLGRGN